jgi:hypothetical protein
VVASDYAKQQSCQDCHMSEASGEVVVSVSGGILQLKDSNQLSLKAYMPSKINCGRITEPRMSKVIDGLSECFVQTANHIANADIFRTYAVQGG